MRITVLAVALMLAVAGPALAADYTVTVEKIAALTGPDAATDMRIPDICGTDIGTITELDGQLYFAFGDTFGYDGLACPQFGPNWRSNLLAHSGDTDASDGITIDGWLTDATDKAIAVTEGAHQPPFTGKDGEQSRIPTAMVTVGNRLYLHFMSVHGFAERGGEWACNFSRFVYSDDKGATWSQAEADFGAANSRFNMLTLSNTKSPGNETGDYVYAIGTACGRFGAGYAARVLNADILDTSAWEYFDGTGWNHDPAAAAQAIPPIAGEGSLAFNAGLGQWMYTTLNQDADAIQLRFADHPWGPWGDAIDLAHAKDFPQLYGAFMTPALIAGDGMSFYFIMSQFGPYNTFVMKASLSPAAN